MKMLVYANSGKVLGVHMCGDDSPEIIQVGARVHNILDFIYFLLFIWHSFFISFFFCVLHVKNGNSGGGLCRH
jgi:hypothetical protein